MPDHPTTSLVLEDIQNHKDDYTWLTNHIESIYQKIKTDLGYDHTAQTAIEMLNVMMPHIQRQQYYDERWEYLLREALRHAMMLMDNEALMQIWTHLGDVYLNQSRYRSASTAYEKAIQRITSTTHLEDRLLARIGMLRSNTIYTTQDVAVFIQETLAMAQQINNCDLIARQHYTLAVAYTHHGLTIKALGHAQVALAHWFNDAISRNRALIIMAEACRVAKRLHTAEWYLNFIRPAYDHSYEDALQAYVRGATLVELIKPTEALTWLKFAHLQFKALDQQYMIGATYQTIALAQTDLEQYDKAQENIRHALIIWEKIDNQYQKAEGLYTLGYMLHCQHKVEEASMIYRKALELADTLLPCALVTGLKARIRTDLQQAEADL